MPPRSSSSSSSSVSSAPVLSASKMSEDELHAQCFSNLAANLLVQPGTARDLRNLARKDGPRRAIAFVMACWCGACWNCVESVNQLFAAVLDLLAEDEGAAVPEVLVFDADVFKDDVNRMLDEGSGPIRGFPSVVLVKGDKTRLYGAGPRTPQALLAAWRQL